MVGTLPGLLRVPRVSLGFSEKTRLQKTTLFPRLPPNPVVGGAAVALEVSEGLFIAGLI